MAILPYGMKTKNKHCNTMPGNPNRNKVPSKHFLLNISLILRFGFFLTLKFLFPAFSFFANCQWGKAFSVGKNSQSHISPKQNTFFLYFYDVFSQHFKGLLKIAASRELKTSWKNDWYYSDFIFLHQTQLTSVFFDFICVHWFVRK